MTIAFDKVTTLALGTGDRNFNHVPVGTPRGVIVYVVDGVGTDQVVGVTYGGTAMTEVTGSPNLLAGGEGGSVHAFWLGASIPTGTQSVAIDRNDATNYIAACYTVTADHDIVIQNIQTSSSTSTAAPGGTLVINVPSFVSGGLYSGSNNPGSTAPTGTTNDITGDFGTDTAAIASDVDIQTANFAFTWSQTADDGVSIVVALREKTIEQAGQTQADIKAIGRGFGQALADILATSRGFGQTQATIIIVNSQFGQAQSDIKAQGYGSGQSQSDIKASGNGWAQSQADIKAISYGLGQSQSDIKATSFGLAQANSDVKTTILQYGQTQADIQRAQVGSAQSQSDIKAVGQGYGQSQSTIKATAFGLAQVQANIESILLVITTHAQAQADILTIEFQVGQSQGQIYITSNSSAQSLASILRTEIGQGNAQASILATVNNYGQAQARIPGEREIAYFTISDRKSINLLIEDREEFQ